MSEELLAISRISPPPAAQADYDAICAALMHTARGRWFLEEYAKRNRSADTKLLLTAIQRIEAVVCAERSKQAAQQGLRTDLLEMAKAITRTRAEVAEIRADATAEQAPPGNGAAREPQQPRDVFAAAERIRDVTWAMRGHGFDPSTCDQLEDLAACILSASSLRDPSDHRASKLSEVLQYLERRIDTLLESCTDADAAAAEPDHQAEPANGFAGHFVAEPVTDQCEPEAADFEAEPSPPSRPAVRLEVEEVEAEAVGIAAVELKGADVDGGDPPDDIQPSGSDLIGSLSRDRAANSSPPQSKSDLSDFDWGRESTWAAPGPKLAPTRPELLVAKSELSPPQSDARSQPPISSQNHALQAQTADAAAAEAMDSADPPPATPVPVAAAPLPAPEPIDSSQLLPKSPALRTTSPAARSFLPEIDMPPSGLDPTWAHRLPPAAAPPPQAPAALASPPPSSQPAAAAVQAPRADPLAELKAMSDNELIALFS
jgi:hypothetical protein